MNTVITLGEIKRIKPREVWPDEAKNFTPWLAENLSQLSEVLGMDLELTVREAPVGDFSCDLLTRDLGTGRIVIIENQYGSTDHDHLGKILTYAAGLDAEAVIWIAEKIREEHRQALEWLNRHTDSAVRFFAVTVEILQIDSSRPAVDFTPVVFPNEWQRGTRDSAEGPSPLGEAYRAYFQSLIDELREKHHFTNANVAQPKNWYTFSSGMTGITYAAVFAKGGRVRAEVYINLDETDKNKALFDRLHARRESLEQDFGEGLTWERLDQGRASRVAIYRPGSIEDSPSELEQIRAWLIERLLRFKAVFGPKIKEILDGPLT